MNRVNRILHHPVFAEHLARLEELEQDRPFCRHGLGHLLDVARMGWIAALEWQIPIQRDVVYAAALLHDLGRVEQLEKGVPHHRAGADLAGHILPEAGFSREETDRIQAAILGHRNEESTDCLGKLIFWADKACRTCWRCGAVDACNWSDEKKNWDLTR